MNYRFAICLLLFPLAFDALGAVHIVKRKKKTKAAAAKAKPKAATARKKPVLADHRYNVVIDKSDYELQVFDAEGWYATYPVVFGNKDQSDKRMEGDRLTPEGTFRIIDKRTPYKWGAIMVLDYPNAASIAKFQQRKARGEIPQNAKPGGGIAIHGTWPGSDWVVDNYVNWTEGCISLRNTDLEELYDLLPYGTKVTIKP
ncbi:MAG: L,D-transpeptidase [Dinghuibacter sp.]|nr:L,D-transpeptidase [Dinghuibacter sp.]